MPPVQQQIPTTGELERLKGEEQRLAALLASVRQQKLSVLKSRPLNVGIIGFGRFGQFMGKSFVKYANVIGTSRADYTKVANDMGAKYLSNLESFVMEEDLDVIVVAVSIVSFEDTIKDLVPYLKKRMEVRGANSCPLIVDVLSVKEHARNVLLEHLPVECDILCTHPMFGPDSAKHGWQGQNFVYERTRVDTILLDPEQDRSFHNHLHRLSRTDNSDSYEHISLHGSDEKYSEAHVAGVDRMERFLSIWEEEGCNMVSMSCSEHDGFTANSQFITHLTGRILGAQGLKATPVSILNTYVKS
jgi:prephenate dehydrogenase